MEALKLSEEEPGVSPNPSPNPTKEEEEEEMPWSSLSPRSAWQKTLQLINYTPESDDDLSELLEIMNAEPMHEDDKPAREPKPVKYHDLVERNRIMVANPVANIPLDSPYWTRIVKCDICGGKHFCGCCSYLMEFPPDGELLDKDKYIIICQCGREVVDMDGQKRCLTKYCRPDRAKRVISRHINVPSIKTLPPYAPDIVT